MNAIERKMTELLLSLRKDFGAKNIRAEFEAEGTKLEELLRLKEISMTAGLGLNLKIGGCESVRDIIEAQIVGVNCIVAPMVESAYALRKYLQAVNKVFSGANRDSLEVYCNIETVTAVENFDDMLGVPEVKLLTGIVVERVDLSFSCGLNEQAINDPRICELAHELALKAKSKGLSCTIGGGVSKDSLEFFNKLSEKNLLESYETRKVCFVSPKALKLSPEKGILGALAFEYLWLKDKLTLYSGITQADQARLGLLEQRYLKEFKAFI